MSSRELSSLILRLYITIVVRNFKIIKFKRNAKFFYTNSILRIFRKEDFGGPALYFALSFQNFRETINKSMKNLSLYIL